MSKLITETMGFDASTPAMQCLAEDLPNGQRKYKIHGIFLQSNRLNGNKRMYPKDVMAEAVRQYNLAYVMSGRAVGELGHPDGPKINLHLVSHKITALREDGNDYWGTAEILDTPNGKIVKAFIDGGVKMGTSSRGLGCVKIVNGMDQVQSDFKLATAGDIVHDPSAPDAFVRGIMEGREFYFDEKLQEWMEGTKKSLKIMSKSQVEARAANLFEDFLSNIVKHK
jgi:hypothetical protein